MFRITITKRNGNDRANKVFAVLAGLTCLVVSLGSSYLLDGYSVWMRAPVVGVAVGFSVWILALIFMRTMRANGNQSRD
jgi:hypothetical protein